MQVAFVGHAHSRAVVSFERWKPAQVLTIPVFWLGVEKLRKKPICFLNVLFFLPVKQSSCGSEPTAHLWCLEHPVVKTDILTVLCREVSMKPPHDFFFCCLWILVLEEERNTSPHFPSPCHLLFHFLNCFQSIYHILKNSLFRSHKKISLLPSCTFSSTCSPWGGRAELFVVINTVKIFHRNFRTYWLFTHKMTHFLISLDWFSSVTIWSSSTMTSFCKYSLVILFTAPNNLLKHM